MFTKHNAKTQCKSECLSELDHEELRMSQLHVGVAGIHVEQKIVQLKGTTLLLHGFLTSSLFLEKSLAALSSSYCGAHLSVRCSLSAEDLPGDLNLQTWSFGNSATF